ncbi:helix-turn-helix domain-containing protein (plasmid) [Citricoccus nitrophenolicus]
MDTAIASAETLLDVEPIGMKVPDFANACGVHRKTVYEWLKRGDLAHITVNGKVIITADTAGFMPDQLGEEQRSIPEFAKACSVSRMTVYRWMGRGLVQHDTVNGRPVITTDPEEFLQSRGTPDHRTVAQFATECGVTRQTVYRWVKRDEVTHVTMNGQLRITADPAEFRRG